MLYKKNRTNNQKLLLQLDNIESSLIDLNIDGISKVETNIDLDINLDDNSQTLIIIDKENVKKKAVAIIDEENDENDKIDYSKMTVSQLKQILIEKKIPVSGNKTKLVQSILDNNE